MEKHISKHPGKAVNGVDVHSRKAFHAFQKRIPDFVIECGADVFKVDGIADDAPAPANDSERPGGHEAARHVLVCLHGCKKFGTCPATHGLVFGKGHTLDAAAVRVFKVKSGSLDGNGVPSLVLDDCPHEDVPLVDTVHCFDDDDSPVLVRLHPCAKSEDAADKADGVAGESDDPLDV